MLLLWAGWRTRRRATRSSGPPKKGKKTWVCHRRNRDLVADAKAADCALQGARIMSRNGSKTPIDEDHCVTPRSI